MAEDMKSPAVDETPAEATSPSSNEATATGPTTTTSAAEPSHQVKEPKRQRTYLKAREQTPPQQTQLEQTPPQQTQPEQTPPQQIQPEQTPPQQIQPEQIQPEKTPPQQTQPEQTPPQQIQSSPQQIQSSPQQTLQDKTPPHVSQGPIYRAMFDYEERTSEDLPFRKGEKLEIINSQDDEWWLARSLDSMKEGYIPRKYVQKFGTVEAEDWFFGCIDRSRADRLFITIHTVPGTFFIRENLYKPGNYSLSIPNGEFPNHYRIRRLDEGGFYIVCRAVFPTLKELVEYYSSDADGLCSNLITPFPAQEKPSIGLSHKTKGNLEIPRESITLVHKLSEGQFVEVFEGLWNETTPVAVTSFKPLSTSPHSFRQEAAIMRKLRHPRLVLAYAVCTQDEPYLMITEFMPRGSLLDYLQGGGEILPFLVLGAQVAAGMAYLEKENYIHGNLAAKNVMVGENNNCKVANFGLTRLISDREGEQNMTGLRWMAPEAALHGQFSIKSDVWSFGVVLAEMVTYGQIPYPGMSDIEVLEQLERGNHMPYPPNTPYNLHQYMQGTWEKNPMERRTFEYLHSVLAGDHLIPCNCSSWTAPSTKKSCCTSM